ncbi:hypothetical protein SAMN05216410_1188 [Sanguibacter gelidistatuariae]|uniref:RAMA domain-containing protein n=1 Tax=Sanguibacter gelidistatuariae TaxID=1814289 RepID=A0A1G6HRM6_9MICO|nr:hypothetical protein [Sanguibacter gelidistatuariae]SDB96861.1 hypothetical protein SAMN05216410_1188 [Sanguibacter gelidistatuariae]
MPLFDIRGAGRAHPVTPTLPDDASFAAAARAVVSEHLPALLGEPLFTVAERPAASVEQRASVERQATADLLALDTSGLPVVVQIMARLTAQGLLEALDMAGRASRLTRADLAAKHPGGPDRFRAGLRAFFDAAPAARPETPSPGTVRLVIVCADVEDSLLHALAFLRSGTTRIEVLHVGLLAGRGGQRLIDVSPLRPEQAAAGRAVESVLTGTVPAVPAPADAYVPVFLDLPPDDLPERPSDLPANGLGPYAAPVSPVLDLLAPPRELSDVVGPVDAALAALASGLDAPLQLVWVRHRRGERFEIVLHPDGSLHTEGGTRYADPTWAASAVSGGTASDGWRVWRVGDEGRTLAELRE